MKRFLFLAVIALSAIALGFIAGCSDDDDSPTGGSTGGDTTLAEFTFINDALGEDGLDGIDMTFELSFSLLDSIPGALASRFGDRNLSLQDSSGGGDIQVIGLTYTYAYSNGWHVFTFDAVAMTQDGLDTLDFSGIDSLQITSGGVPQPTVPLTSDGLKIRNHFDMSTRVGLDTMSSFHSLDFVGDVLSDIGTVTISGSGSDVVSTSYTDGETNCDLDITNAITINSVVMQNGSDDCPTSGSLVNQATINLACVGAGLDSLNVNGGWTVTWTFTGTLEHITFTDGTTTWSITRECGSGGELNPTDTMFVSDILSDGEIFENVFRSIDASFALLDSVPNAAPTRRGTMHALQGQDIIFVVTSRGTYSYSVDDWHIFTGFTMLAIDQFFNDTTTVTGTDSVKIFVNGVAVQNVSTSDSLDGVSARAHIAWANNSGNENGNFDHSVDVTAVPNGVDTIITIDATAHDSIWVNDMELGYGCSMAVGISQTITGMQMNVAMTSNDCPLAGSITANATIDAFCVEQGQFGDDTLQFSGAVSISATVNQDQSFTFSYDDGTTAWSTTQPCVVPTLARHSVWLNRD